MYELLGLAYIEPELREDRGELAAAAAAGGGRIQAESGSVGEDGSVGSGGSADSHGSAGPDGLPQLIELTDIRGDLHCHTIASDGKNTIEEMAVAARELGYEYLAITDHSASHGFGNDVSPDELRRQIELVREANERLDGIGCWQAAR